MGRATEQRRILLLGHTGLAKDVAVSNLKKYAATQGTSASFAAYDFEKDYLLPGNRIEIHTYLESDYLAQRRHWREGWEQFLAKKDEDASHLVLGLHGVVTRPDYGVRSPIDIPRIVAFKPDLIVTLIDDVYFACEETRQRAKGATFRGVPTLEQLIDARRHETLLGDLLAAHCGDATEHVVLAVSHPARTLHRLIFNSQLRPVYLSFPISGPRRSKKKGDDSGIHEVNAFLREASQFEAANSQVVCYCPLTIDEYPLCDLVPSDAERVTFDTGARWPVRGFWKDEILLNDNVPHPPSVEFEREEVEHVAGMIRADVRKRDYRLVAQSKRLAVFNPWYEGVETKGVKNEIISATMSLKPVFVYQDPRHDPDGYAQRTLKPSGGSLGPAPRSEYITFAKSIDDLFAQLVV